jgi:hypothetical protein
MPRRAQQEVVSSIGAAEAFFGRHASQIGTRSLDWCRIRSRKRAWEVSPKQVGRTNATSRHELVVKHRYMRDHMCVSGAAVPFRTASKYFPCLLKLRYAGRLLTYAPTPNGRLGGIPMHGGFVYRSPKIQLRVVAAAVVLLLTPNIIHARPAKKASTSGLEGSWSGGGTVVFASGSREQARCRAHYRRAGIGYTVSATCATASARASQIATLRPVGEKPILRKLL